MLGSHECVEENEAFPRERFGVVRFVGYMNRARLIKERCCGCSARVSNHAFRGRNASEAPCARSIYLPLTVRECELLAHVTQRPLSRAVTARVND